ncbi:Mur ligase family protein, partial [Pseudokineococcus marinus]
MTSSPAPPGHPRPTLGDLATRLGAHLGDAPAAARVTGLHHDSRVVGPGDVWLALPGGGGRHGADHSRVAVARGALAAVSDRACPGLPTLLVPDPRRVAGVLADWLHGHPSADLGVVGVTGTNGKTSTTHLLEAGMAAAGASSGLLSGLVARGPWGERPATLTTPEAADLQRDLGALRDAGVERVALEVSSHALALHRVDGTRFRAAVFTGLAPDHLDLHGDMESYLEAKARLFAPERSQLAVVSLDDEWGRRLARRVTDAGQVPLVTTSARGRRADWTAVDVRASTSGTRFRLRGPGTGAGTGTGTDRAVGLRLLGEHQADNALSALAALLSTGTDADAAVRGVEGLAGVPGRLEPVDGGQPFRALVDFAHNAHGVERALRHLRSTTSGRLIVVTGQRGGRDPGKAVPLGRAAGGLADVVVVTDEGAHDDDPARLRALVVRGARDA